MKRAVKIDHLLTWFSGADRKDFASGITQTSKDLSLSRYKLINPGRRKGRFIITLVFTFLFIPRAVAPICNTMVVFETSPFKPFSKLMYATAMVETMMNPLAYNEKEHAAGIFQIRQVRIDEYNRLTGHNYTLKDVFDPAVSEKIFLYFASRIGPYRFEKIAKDWNGSGPKTELYWKRVRKYL